MPGPTRQCTRCEERKTVRGVWYLVALPGDGSPEFYCESCFQGPAVGLRSGSPGAAAAALPLHGGGLGF